MAVPDRVVLVTGAAGGLGAAVARRLAEPGTALVLCDLSGPGLAAVAQSLDVPVLTRVVDVGDAAQVDAAVAAAVEKFGGLHVMVNNAGVIAPNARIHNLTAADWDLQLRVNLMGVVHGMTAAIRVMRKAGGGSIINTASVAGLTAWAHAAPYCATKAAVVHLTKVAAVEYAKERIRVNCVCPGAFTSGMSEKIPREAMAALEAKHPLGFGTPDDLAGAFAYLAGEESRWTTGAAIVVDGGYAAP
ncbi:dihydroanticapsin 7-dehydrogenase [Pseudonocardia sulfidoxydans NBRC 16205]|uniref:Dihydroanticapsin 7-dehydrogenase n=1 Tax=Pseudonocardia sulfidoxydans NBRC 16205 TaxID=1223511 RepID=A0A511DM62_9PSEU|nr:SDR family oxidoreductase [Pseudonocardia sulfidoxydans]GEL25909.1 dihydroanticapsin 7-dehydrogenase [Pseudonocardia sulfidoxydans NBRC 16205]